MKCYFLSAYHYALARLTAADGYMFPGLIILDYPPTLADGTQLTGHEDYLVEPFIALSQQKKIQVIAAGQGFGSLPGVHRIDLSTIWRPTDSPDA